jgi:uncharacterized protein (TIGR02284 family)
MAEDIVENLKSLHTRAIDARNGYDEALEDAEGKGLTPLFREMIALHAGHAAELEAALNRHGEKADHDGSFMSSVHRTIMSVRGLFGGLDDSVLPGLIDGEERNASGYADALGLPEVPDSERAMLQTQKSRIDAALARMRAARPQ